MSARNILMAAGGSADDTLYVDDVFSAYTYTGNGTIQTINNGIDLAGKGGMVWIKSRSNDVPHYLQDSARSNFGQSLQSQTTDAHFATTYITSVTSAGYSVSGNANLSGQSTVAWTFRKAPKFFDVVTGVGPGTFAHALGVTPGMVIIKPSSIADNWYVHHRSLTGGIAGSYTLTLNSTAAEGATGTNHVHTDTTINVGGNIIGGSTAWVAYLFAHDPSADGIIQCGSFTTDGSGNATVTLGWEPQYVMFKRTDSTGAWPASDSMRGMEVGGNGKELLANTSGAETSQNVPRPSATGFYFPGTAGRTYIYLAIRRPNKPPTTGTQVYNHLTRTGTEAAATVTGVGFAPDLVFSTGRNTASVPTDFVDRMRGPKARISPGSADAEFAYNSVSGPSAFSMDGVDVTPDASLSRWNRGAYTYINHFFKRAPGFMDVVCYTGTGVSGTIPHNLKTIPQLIFIKKRTSAFNWAGAFALIPASGINAFSLNLPDAPAMNPYNFGVNLSSSSFNPHNIVDASITEAVNVGGVQYVAYLFASLPGISKVGSYTGNGTSQTINCGFTTGARFILIKRTDSTGDWYVWDTARGIVAGNDPHLSLNTTAAEVTTNDSIDPDASGFIVNQVAATNINVSGGTYIFLAIA